MRSTRILLSTGALVVLCAGLLAQTNPPTTTERAHAKALEVVNASVQAYGGEEVLRDIKNVTIKATSTQSPRLQMTTVSGGQPGTLDETVVLDLDKGRMRVEQKGKGQGFEGWNIIAMDGKEGVNLDELGKSATPIPAA